MQRVLSLLLLAGSLLLLCSLLSVQWVASDTNFYRQQFAALDRAKVLAISESDLERYSQHTIRYLLGREQDPNLKLVVGGQERWFLNDKEVSHMQDVQALFRLARRMTVGLLLGLGVALLITYRRGQLHLVYSWLTQGAATALAIGGASVFLISQDFTSAFTLFHELSFTNDLWLLNPAEDLLINLLPEAFFAAAAKAVAYRSCGLLLLLILVSYCGGRISQWAKQ